jgi:predicted Zn-dependent protease
MNAPAVSRPGPFARRSLKAGTGALLIAALGFLLWSCRSTAESPGTGGGGQIAATLGVVDTEEADAGQPGDTGSRALEEITPEQEYYLGRAVGAAILSRYQIWNGNAALTKYLNEICTAIVINSPQPDIFNGYHVALLDSAELNAFATPGGHIFITRGLFACADSEDVLAAVIAHEIGHIQLRHSIKALRKSRIAQTILAASDSQAKTRGTDSAVNVKELAGIMDELVNDLVTTLIEKGYSWEQEFDADTAAMALMAAAGYDPSGLITMLRHIESQGSSCAGLAKTHPSPARRIGNAQETAVKFKIPDTRSYRQARYNWIVK